MASLLTAYGEILLPLIFVGFFVFGFIAMMKRGWPRRVFVVSVVCLLTVWAIFAFTIYPFTHAHRYSTLADQSIETHDIVLVDSAGNEVSIDPRTTVPIRYQDLAAMLVESDSDHERIQLAAGILTDADRLRGTVEGPVPRLRHPPPAAVGYWERSTFEGAGELETVRVLRVEVTYGYATHDVVRHDESCILEVTPRTERVIEACPTGGA